MKTYILGNNQEQNQESSNDFKDKKIGLRNDYITFLLSFSTFNVKNVASLNYKLEEVVKMHLDKNFF